MYIHTYNIKFLFKSKKLSYLSAKRNTVRINEYVRLKTYQSNFSTVRCRSFLLIMHKICAFFLYLIHTSAPFIGIPFVVSVFSTKSSHFSLGLPHPLFFHQLRCLDPNNIKNYPKLYFVAFVDKKFSITTVKSRLAKSFSMHNVD